MIERYQYLEIEKIWNDQNKFDTWKLVEQKYLETLEENNISPGGIAEVIEKTESFKGRSIRKRENHKSRFSFICRYTSI
jgi:adenylosuccinate lyase